MSFPTVRRATLTLALCAVARAQYIANVVSYGAVGDGVTLNTHAFVAATADIAAHGGGVLYVPPGRFLLSPFNLTSRLELRLDGATLLASVATDGVCNFVDWTVIAPLPSYGRGRDFPGPRYTSLLHGWNLTDVRITSNSSEYGVVDGQGGAWWECIKNGSLIITPGHLVELLYSERIEIDHVRFVDSPFWNLHPWVAGVVGEWRLPLRHTCRLNPLSHLAGCRTPSPRSYSSRYVHIHDIAVEAPIHSTNTDGIDPDSTQHLLAERLNISTGDGACRCGGVGRGRGCASRRTQAAAKPVAAATGGQRAHRRPPPQTASPSSRASAPRASPTTSPPPT
jgi:hypothetical protein